MAKVEVDVDVHENSLDNSADDGEYGMGMVDEGSFESSECERAQLVTNNFLDANEDTASSYRFKDISGHGVTYEIVLGEESNNMSSHSPAHVMPSGEFYVLSNSDDIFGTAATQKKVIRRQPIQAKALTTKKRDDKRRATHNEVERRRRDKINSWITKLAALVPNSGLPDTASKGGILAKACDHITDLTERQKKLEKLEVDNDKLVVEILRLNQELAELRKENSSMRIQLSDKCIMMPTARPKREKS